MSASFKTLQDLLTLFHGILRPDNNVNGSWHIELANTRLHDNGLNVYDEYEILEKEAVDTAKLLTRIERAVKIFEKKSVNRGTRLMLGILKEFLGDEKNNLLSKWSLEWSRRYIEEVREEKRKKIYKRIRNIVYRLEKEMTNKVSGIMTEP